MPDVTTRRARHAAAWLAAASAAGCLQAPPPHSEADAAAVRDGAPATDGPPACAHGPFTPPDSLDGAPNTFGDDWLGDVSADERAIVTYRYPDGEPQPELVLATRDDPDSPFVERPADLAAINTTASESAGALTEDLLTFVFVSARSGGAGGLDLWYATRQDVEAPFETPVPLAELNTPDGEDVPVISRDGRTIYFGSDRAGWPRLYRAERDGASGPFGNLDAVDGLDDEEDGIFGGQTLSEDELEIFFASSRAGGWGGDLDIWTARREATTAPFGAAQIVDVLSSPRDDSLPALSGDGATLYFNYDSLIAGGRDADVWVARRACR